MKATAKKYWLPVFVGILFCLMFIFVTVKFFFQAQKINDLVIAQNISQLNDIFSSINQTAGIAGFKHQIDHIDFLNVKSFEGFAVGSMILVDPKKWSGPYLRQNLVIESKEYQVVRASKGYYILPGDGVRLSNGITIGQNLKIDETTDIDSLMRDPKFLMTSTGKPLAAFIEISENPQRKSNDDLIADHIFKLSSIFRQINQTCQITGFRHEKDHIDFLNVKEFDGNIIGSMNLVNPKKWEGPYLQNNLTIDDKFYQIVNTKQGFFIIPDDGIVLSNGQVIGQTLIINRDTDMQSLLNDPKGLLVNGKPLAARIETVRDSSGMPIVDLDEED